ncbi:hypothetical protein GGI19_005263 [Coemansia pectinata]|uniref:RING-type domain-containing protein n=1 Tax=Coemansia pectinata TaxID=1052879 RepID=A0A9W8GRB3_9FUNG|nr:hypothetical protein GGI19_005263 [Coemansia pectinata]
MGNVLRECELDSVSQLVEPGASAVPDRCPICLEAMTLGFRDDERGASSSSSSAFLRVLRCEHRFHAQCVDPWLTTCCALCPMCKSNIRNWEGFEQSLRSKQDGGSVNVQNLGPVTGLRDRPLIRPMRPIPKALLSYSPMDDLSLLQITNFLGECDCTPRGNVEPAKRPVRESENESGPVTPPAKRPKLAHIPPVLSEPFVSSKSAATNSSYTSSSGSSGSSRSSTHSTPKTVVHDKAPAPAARSHQTPTPAKAKSMATPATSRPVPKT